MLATELYGYFGTERPLTPEAEFDRDRDYFAHEGLTVPIAVADPRQAPVRGADGNFAAKPSTNDAAYEVGGIPQIHIIDKQGRIRLIMVGYDDANEKSLATVDRAAAEREIVGTRTPRADCRRGPEVRGWGPAPVMLEDTEKS